MASDREKDPHDRLVRDTLSIPENAVTVLGAALPPDVLARVDLSTLRAEPGTFVDRRSEARTDLLFSVRMGPRRALVYLLLEHQSRPDPEMPRRMLMYMERIWRAHRRAHGRGPLPVILPVVLHHGPTGWTAARSLSELLDVDDDLRRALAPHVPDFELIVDDLARVSERQLLARDGAALGRVVVWVLRAARVGFEPTWLPAWIHEMNRAEATGAEEAFLHLVEYLLRTEEGAALYEALRHGPLSDRVREVVMGYQQRWMEEGRAEGRAEGRDEGRAEVLVKLLRMRFADVPEAVERRVRHASPEDVDRWIERVLSAETLDDLFA